MRMKALLTLTGILLAGMIQAANPTLKFKVKGMENDTTVILAYYFGNKLYISEKGKADATGSVTFGPEKKYEPGIYALVMRGGTKSFEFVVNNENIHMETDTTDLAGKMIVKTSVENKAFYDYIHFLNAKKAESDPYREKLKTVDAKSKEAEELRAKLSDIDKQVKQKQADIYNKTPKLLIGKVIWLSIDPEIPESPKDANGKVIDTLFTYKYAKAHYWDHFDFNDDRLVRTPFFQNKLESYFKNMILQSPDTLIKEADILMSRLKDSTDTHKFVLNWLTYYVESSKVMCMDAAFVHMVYKYYKTGKAHWLDAEKLAKIVDRAEKLGPITCGSTVFPLSMLDTTGKKWRRLFEIQADFTVLIFWDPECGHCKKEMPKFVEMYKKMKSQGVEIYAVSSDFNDKWKSVIREYKMDFINVAIPQEYYSNGGAKGHEAVRAGLTNYESLNYRDKFDIFSTPKVFLLDRNKRILAKQIEAEQCEKLIEHFRSVK
jgi:thiol-disulfide isomerase/thioredoxin